MESLAISEDIDLKAWLKHEGLSPRILPEKTAASDGGSSTILLTGCTGFLGRHILLELLSSDLCGRVYCHARGKDEGVWTWECMCVSGR